MSMRFYLNDFQVFENHLLPTAVLDELKRQGLTFNQDTDDCFEFEVVDIAALLEVIKNCFIDELLDWGKRQKTRLGEYPDILSGYEPTFFREDFYKEEPNFGRNKTEFFQNISKFKNEQFNCLSSHIEYKLCDHRLYSFLFLIHSLPIAWNNGKCVATEKIIAQWR